MARRDEPAGGAGRPWVRAMGWAIVALTGLFALTIALAPTSRASDLAPTLIYDRTGGLLATLSPGTRLPVALAEMPAALQDATLATEDANFYRDHGINPVAILRAGIVDVRSGQVREGGSTITQQLARTLYLSNARTIWRKLAEVVYTLRLEATHTKAQILDLYLNSIYYGEGAYGAGAAARVYFARDVSSLDLAQCALLAGLAASPNGYDPFLHPQAARQRELEVLTRMVATGYITRAQQTAAAGETLHFARGDPSAQGPPANAFIDDVLREIGSARPALERAVRQGGYRIYTTLDPAMQQAADTDFAQYLPPGTPDASGVLQPEGALVAIDPTSGAVRAMVGGRPGPGSAYNRAVLAMRQPGSTFKAFLYAAAIGLGHAVTQRQYDGPVSYPGAAGQTYSPVDFDGYTRRWLTMREAVAISDNVVAVKWANAIGPQRVITVARRMGITSPLEPTLPLVLGTYDVTPLELADAYVPLANLGTAYPAWAVISVVAPDGHTAWQPAKPRPRQALDPGVAYIVTSLLQSVMTDGTGKALQGIVDRPVAGKTGSTNDLKDAWFVGYTPNLVCAVWVGDDQPASLQGYGATLAGPAWAHFMADALAATPPRDWAMPGDVSVVTVSAADGLLPSPTSPTVAELFLAGTAPKTVSPLQGSAGGDPGLTGLPGTQVAPPALGTPALPSSILDTWPWVNGTAAP